MTSHYEFDPPTRLEGEIPERDLDGRSGLVYVVPEDLKRAVVVARATGRPLLLLGPPGSGKSSLARFAAGFYKFNYFETVVTSRTQARDLQWHFDAVRRLNDPNPSEDLHEYIEPRVLWWAFRPGDLEHRREEAPGHYRAPSAQSVVLIDEIDKADPDVPNDLLVALGAQEFFVTEIKERVKAKDRPLIIITTNRERALPAAFLRRCIVHRLTPPTDVDGFTKIAEAHFPNADKALLKALAAKMLDLGSAPSGGHEASVAEYLDAVRACIELGVTPTLADKAKRSEDEEAKLELWKTIHAAILVKDTGDDW